MELGWLSPSGDFFPCEMYDHIHVADKIVRQYGYQALTSSNDDILMKNGWVHITRSMFDHELRIYWDKYLTEYQKNFLKEYFEQDIFPVSEICKYAWECENR